MQQLLTVNTTVMITNYQPLPANKRNCGKVKSTSKV